MSFDDCASDHVCNFGFLNWNWVTSKALQFRSESEPYQRRQGRFQDRRGCGVSLGWYCSVQ